MGSSRGLVRVPPMTYRTWRRKRLLGVWGSGLVFVVFVLVTWFVLWMALQPPLDRRSLMLSLSFGVFALVGLVVVSIAGLANYRAARAAEAGKSLAPAKRTARVGFRTALIGVVLCGLQPVVQVLLLPAIADRHGVAFVGVYMFVGALSILLFAGITSHGIKTASMVTDRQLQ